MAAPKLQLHGPDLPCRCAGGLAGPKTSPLTAASSRPQIRAKTVLRQISTIMRESAGAARAETTRNLSNGTPPCSQAPRRVLETTAKTARSFGKRSNETAVSMHVITGSVFAPANTADLIDRLMEVTPAEASIPVAIPSDRRRPGRPGQVIPTLVPLLRGAAQNVDTDPDIDYTAAPLAAAHGIAVGMCLAVPLWAMIGLSGWLIWSIL
jgi:hypothetical protein